MKTKNFKDISLSRLGMGNMRLPVENDKDGAPIDYDRAESIIDYAIDNGITYFDTAYVYHSGESEKFLGKALMKHPRDSFFVATKFLIFASKDYKAVFEEQLERLQTDHIDFYLIHGINDSIYQEYIDLGCIEYFEEQKRAGRIKYLGFSSHASPDKLKIFAEYRDWDFAQIQLNYYDWVYGSAKKEYEILKELNIPIMVMEPVRGGRLATLSEGAQKILKDAHPDWSVASWALRWVKNLSQVQVVLSGMSNMEQIVDNVSTFSDDVEFTKADEEVLMKALEVFKSEITVPCTSCRYCCDDCPSKIEIPKFLNFYNRYKSDGNWVLGQINDIESEGRPADCIACGACATQCPQGINIPEVMQELNRLTAK
ncbi:MAG: 4Fe-4S dicluster domain-containing protein [Lachnospiraceae bacterium]|nr:4Fe-4S dicluster domain-containing protein [Lachnospiraceae bacterium]